MEDNTLAGADPTERVSHVNSREFIRGAGGETIEIVITGSRATMGLDSFSGFVSIIHPGEPIRLCRHAGAQVPVMRTYLGQEGKILRRNPQPGERGGSLVPGPLRHADLDPPLILHGILDEARAGEDIDHPRAVGPALKSLLIDREEVVRRLKGCPGRRMRTGGVKDHHGYFNAVEDGKENRPDAVRGSVDRGLGAEIAHIVGRFGFDYGDVLAG